MSLLPIRYGVDCSPGGGIFDYLHRYKSSNVNPNVDEAANQSLTVGTIQFGPKIDPPGLDLRRFSEGVGGSGDVAIALISPQQREQFHKAEIEGKYARFMPIAQAFADMSKLPGTKVGCLILGSAFEVLSTGWNGAPRGSNADVDQRVVERDERLKWVVHAEMNAIANAARAGTALDGATLLCTLMPCMTCAKSIVQAGIKRVLCPTPTEDSSRWSEEFNLARRLFTECSVELLYSDIIGDKE